MKRKMEWYLQQQQQQQWRTPSTCVVIAVQSSASFRLFAMNFNGVTSWFHRWIEPYAVVTVANDACTPWLSVVTVHPFNWDIRIVFYDASFCSPSLFPPCTRTRLSSSINSSMALESSFFHFRHEWSNRVGGISIGGTGSTILICFFTLHRRVLMVVLDYQRNERAIFTHRIEGGNENGVRAEDAAASQQRWRAKDSNCSVCSQCSKTRSLTMYYSVVRWVQLVPAQCGTVHTPLLPSRVPPQCCYCYFVQRNCDGRFLMLHPHDPLFAQFIPASLYPHLVPRWCQPCAHLLVALCTPLFHTSIDSTPSRTHRIIPCVALDAITIATIEMQQQQQLTIAQVEEVRKRKRYNRRWQGRRERQADSRVEEKENGSRPYYA